MATKQKKQISKQSYSIEIIHYDDGSSVMNRCNDGFSIIEIIGLTALVSSDMQSLIKENFKTPDEINRVSKRAKFIAPKK